jgi:ATP-dependent DNA helicase RecQ
LRSLRKELADAQDVPPYVIFHDATLMAMVDQRPRTLTQMGALNGVGQRKLERYGDDFLGLLARFQSAATQPEDTTQQSSLVLARLGMSVEQISQQRSLTPDTVYAHLAMLIRSGEAELEEVLDLPNDYLKRIEAALLADSEGGTVALKTVHEAVGGNLDYGVLRCVRSALQARGEL